MSANRILILVGVLIVVLFGISLALSKSKQGGMANPKTSFFQNLNFSPSTKFDLAEVSARGGVLGGDGKWTITNAVTEASLIIATNKSGHRLRTLKLSLELGDPCAIQFIPLPDTNQPGKLADAEATPFKIKIKKLQPDEPALVVTIMEHGGTLVVTRTTTSPAVFKIE